MFVTLLGRPFPGSTVKVDVMVRCRGLEGTGLAGECRRAVAAVETKASPAGVGSSTTVSVAVDGPAFRIVSV